MRHPSHVQSARPSSNICRVSWTPHSELPPSPYLSSLPRGHPTLVVRHCQPCLDWSGSSTKGTKTTRCPFGILVPFSTLPFTIAVMSPLPPRDIGRPQDSRRGQDEPRRSDSVRQSWHDTPPSSPPPSEFHDRNLLRHCLQPLHRPADTVAQKWEDDLGMDALEVGVLRSKRPIEHTSHDTAQQALLAMRRDADDLAAIEHQHHKDRRDSLLMEPDILKKHLAPKKKSKNKSVVSRDAKTQLRSLAATHPSFYSQPSNENIPSMSPRVLPARVLEVEHTHAHQEPERAIPLWQIDLDPKNLISPISDDPRFRMLKMDVESERPNVISPTFLISLPFGTLIEGACQYESTTDKSD